MFLEEKRCIDDMDRCINNCNEIILVNETQFPVSGDGFGVLNMD